MGKIINEKGKLFGIINVVDLVVLIAVICVAGAIVWQLLGNKVTDAVSEQADLTMVVCIAGANPDLVQEIERQDLVGEKLVSGNIFLNAYISDISYRPYEMDVETADGRLVSATSPTQLTVVVEIKSPVPRGTASPSIGSQECRAGKTFIVKTQTFECAGIIYYVDIAGAANAQ